MAKLYYRFYDAELDAENSKYLPLYLKPSNKNSSSWFKDLPPNISYTIFGKLIPSLHKFHDFIKRKAVNENDEIAKKLMPMMNGGKVFLTAKHCPGIQHILDKSLLVTAPCDIHITVFKNGTWIPTIADTSLVQMSNDHPNSQWIPKDSKNNIFKGKVALKFHFPLDIGTDTPHESYIFLQPQYHNNIPLEVVNGVISGKYSIVTNVNLITLVDIPTIDDYDIVINKGDVLAYIWGTEKLNITYKKKPFPLMKRTSFIHSDLTTI